MLVEVVVAGVVVGAVVGADVRFGPELDEHAATTATSTAARATTGSDRIHIMRSVSPGDVSELWTPRERRAN
jgi:hypothetical protein